MSDLSDAIVDRLRRAGIGMLFGVPGGGGNLDLIESAGRAGLRFVLTATETAAALAAVGQAEVTGRPGACLATLGPGAASLVNGVACAYLDRAPLVVFTDRHPLAADDRYTHQHLDQRALFAPITKWSGTVSAAAIDRALCLATAGQPGPVHLDCPDDASAEDRPVSEAAGVSPADPQALAAAVAGARRPVVIAGLGARRSEDAAAIRSLCESRRIPAMVTYKAKGVVPDDHAWFAGVFTNAVIERPLIEASDLIVGIGLDPVELIPRPWPYRQRAIYIGRWTVPSEHVPFGIQYVGDVVEGVRAIERALQQATWTLDEIASARDVGRTFRSGVSDVGRTFRSGVSAKAEAPASTEGVSADGRALTAHRVVQIAAERLAATHRVTVDAGAHMVPATMLWPVTEPNGMLISNGLSTMGFALPAAIGAALAEPDRPVVALTGDGGLLMCAAELLTAVRERLRIITIVFSDASLSLIEIKQQHKRYSSAGVALGSIDWTALARGFGATPFVARDDTELGGAIDRAAGCDGPSLIEARIDRSTYARTFQAVRG